jgi:superoxide dismutase
MQNQLELHYGRHHKAYVDNLNKQIAGSELDKKGIVEIIKASWANGKPTPAFNNAGQIWSACPQNAMHIMQDSGVWCTIAANDILSGNCMHAAARLSGCAPA